MRPGLAGLGRAVCVTLVAGMVEKIGLQVAVAE
jgi:hypothetical protein